MILSNELERDADYEKTFKEYCIAKSKFHLVMAKYFKDKLEVLTGEIK